jgi:hypothetical protein
MISIIGQIPDWMFKGKLVNDYFSKEKLLFIEVNEENNDANVSGDNSNKKM